MESHKEQSGNQIATISLHCFGPSFGESRRAFWRFVGSSLLAGGVQEMMDAGGVVRIWAICRLCRSRSLFSISVSQLECMTSLRNNDFVVFVL